MTTEGITAEGGRGKILLQTPMLWATGALALLILSAVSDWFTARADATVVLHNPRYETSHVLYVVKMFFLFAVFAGFYFGFPRITGYRYSEMLGRLHFGLSFAGVVLAILPWQTSLPRRYADYPGAFTTQSLILSAGAFMAAASMVVFLGVLAEAFWHKRTR